MSELRRVKRDRERLMQKLYKQPPTVYTELPEEKKPEGVYKWYANNHHTVYIYEQDTTRGKAFRVVVMRHDGGLMPHRFSEMQLIKNELFSEDTIAIEYYPKQSEFINEDNSAWMYVYEDESILPLPIFDSPVVAEVIENNSKDEK